MGAGGDTPVRQTPCVESELLQFSTRFLEWLFIIKVIDESEDLDRLDLRSIIRQSRLWGKTQEEKKNVLKVGTVWKLSTEAPTIADDESTTNNVSSCFGALHRELVHLACVQRIDKTLKLPCVLGLVLRDFLFDRSTTTWSGIFLGGEGPV